MNAREVTVALVQQPPAVLDLAASLRRAIGHINDAAARGAQLVVFPETWLTCYPAWVFGMAGWQDDTARAWYARLLDESCVLDHSVAADVSDPRNATFTDDLAPLRAAIARVGVTVVMGINERATRTSGTLYNSLITIGPDGHTLNLHRKLTPTHTERIVWAAGDAAGLRVVDTPAGRVGGLICWEHWSPLSRQALHAQSEQIHVSAWPDVPEPHHLASRHYAFEGRCFVLCSGQFLTTDDVPSELLADYLKGVGPDAPAEGVLFDGGSGIVGPDGNWVVEPVVGEATTIVATIDLGSLAGWSHDLDVAGHYARPDVFSLTVDRSRRGSGVSFSDA
jgi:nitrilase